eukprot:c21256_g1_i2.p1 GENE.c21256_g1_i2~~c21256_g1_i2.p1  ORF type:complete len:311 (+),score=101.40 c21256_g1_i2:89-1021(+)
MEQTNARLIFLGTGSSGGTPRLSCLLTGDEDYHKYKTSQLALSTEPHLSKNYRCNPSLLIETPSKKCIQIDAGKTFREAVIRWYPRHKIKSLDAIILSHEHADAMLGLDDVRGFQKNGSPPMPVYLSDHSYQSVSRVFPYLIEEYRKHQKVPRHVAQLSWNIISSWRPFTACGVEFLPIPVMHGEDYVSLGFIFGTVQKIVYISDVSRIPFETNQYLVNLPQIDILILDLLFKKVSHPTHFNFPDCLQTVRQLRPKMTYFVGMFEIEHDSTNLELQQYYEKEGLKMELAYDGLAIDVYLEQNEEIIQAKL